MRRYTIDTQIGCAVACRRTVYRELPDGTWNRSVYAEGRPAMHDTCDAPEALAHVASASLAWLSSRVHES